MADCCIKRPITKQSCIVCCYSRPRSMVGANLSMLLYTVGKINTLECKLEPCCCDTTATALAKNTFMKQIEIDAELYSYIASHTQSIGESASDILRRLLALPPLTGIEK